MTASKRARRGFTIMELTVVMAIVVTLAAILFPVFGQARAAARKSQCQEHLYQLGLAMQLYARDNDGRLPARFNDFSALTAAYITDPSILRCPELPAAQTGPAAGYQYRGGLTLEDRPDIPLAADWGFWHGDGGNVLFLSGSVKFFSGAHWVPVSRGPSPYPPRTGTARMPFINDFPPQTPSPKKKP